jgi:stage V sporulation protein G
METAEIAVKRLVRFDGAGSVKALCDVEVRDQFLIRGLRIVDGKNGTFVSMPRQQGKNGKWFDMVSPLSKEVKTALESALLEAYEKDAVQSHE